MKNPEYVRCFLIVETTDLKGPLTIFQNTRFAKSDFKKLVKTINGVGGDNKLDDSVLDEVFTMWWPKLEKQVNTILEDHKTQDEGEHRSERDILEEILELSRLNTRRSRHDIGMSPKVIMDLMESITELTYTIERGDIKRAHMLCERLDRPIRYMCKTSEYPELFDRYMMKRRKIRHQFDVDENEETT